jgi:DHA1 family bicyclomycin/chloramphenicol resistance-like MFS transporter
VDQASAKKLHDSTDPQQPKPWGLLILLMAVTSVGPTSLNILLPALPELSRLLNSDIGTLQLTISLYLVGLAVAQLIVGPLSDRFGRRPVLMGGLLLTVAASLLAIVMPTVESLIVARVVQAVGASAGIVVSRAIIRDLFGPQRAASVLGLVATVMIAVPTFGPLIGGILDTLYGWQAIFVFLATISFAVLTWVALTLPETLGLNAPDHKQIGFLQNLKLLANSRIFWAYVLAGALGSASFFAFLGGGPHVVVTLMGRTSAEYGVWFAITSIGYMAGNFTASRLAVRHHITTMVWAGVSFEAAGVIAATLLAAFAHHWGPIILFGPQMLISFGNGLLLPASISGAISVRPQAAGTAAGIIGCTQMAVGAAVTQYTGTLLADASSALPIALVMWGLMLALVLSLAALMRRPKRT